LYLFDLHRADERFGEGFETADLTAARSLRAELS